MAKNIRSNYIKQIANDTEVVAEAMQEVMKNSLRGLLDESTKKTLRKIISEGNDFSEDEVEDPTLDKPEDSKDDEMNDVDVEDAAGEDDVDGADDTEDVAADTESVEDDVDDTSLESTDDEGGEDDVWNELDDFKGEDDVYDLTKMDKDQLVKVFKALGPEDGVVVVKNDDGTVELTDDETEMTYIIDLGDDEEPMGESKSEFGNHPSYNSPAMTTPSNEEPADPSTTYSMDDGAPTSTGRPYGNNKGDGGPFKQPTNESDETEFEIDLGESEDEEVNETMTTQEQGPYNRGTGMVHTNTNAKAAKGRNSFAGGEQVHGTSQNSYSGDGEAQLESLKRKANAILRENKELKKLLPTLVKKLQESVLVNQNMGNIINLIKENSTTKAEKMEIVQRFAKVQSIEESNKLYTTINEELSRKPAAQLNLGPNVQTVDQKTITESREDQNSPMYQSKDMRDLIARIDNVYKKH